MSDFLKGIGAVTLMLSTAAVVFLAVCGLIEWYFTWVFSIFPIKPYLIPILLVHSFLFGGEGVRYFKILWIVLFASLLVACHQISSGTVVDKYIDEPHTTFIPAMNGKSSVLVPTRNKRKYILVVSGYAGNKQVEETFEVTAEEYIRYEIGNTFIQDAVLENKEGDKQ